MLQCEATGNWTRDPPVCAGMAGPPSSSIALWRFQLSHKHILNVVEGDSPGAAKSSQLSNVWLYGFVSEDGAFLKQVLAYSSGSALAVAAVVLSGGLIALLAKRLSDRGTEMLPATHPSFGQGLSGKIMTVPGEAGVIRRV